MNQKLLFACAASLLFAMPAHAGEAVWITNVKLVSPEKLDRIEPGSVLVQDGRIVRVERGPRRTRPAGARRFDGHGYYLTPGLIDSHVHLQLIPGMSPEQAGEKADIANAYYAQLPRSYLYYGYTTVVDLAVSDFGFIDRFRQAPLRPDVVHCGSPLVVANGYPMVYSPSPQRFSEYSNFVYDPAQAASIPPGYSAAEHTPAASVARAKASGAVCAKVFYERGFGSQHNLPVMSAAMFAEARKAATANALALVTHANTFEAQKFAVDGNTDVLAHGMWRWDALDGQAELPAEIKALLDRIVEKRVGYQPTMQVLYGLRAYVDPSWLRDPRIRSVVPASMAAWFNTPEAQGFREEVAGGASDEQAREGLEGPLRRVRQVVAYLAAHNANFLFGSDTPSAPTYGNLPGLNGYLEMQRLREAGMSPAQVFKAATIGNARAFGLGRTVGTIEPGKTAHLLLMKTSPLRDMTAYDKIVTVWVGGRQVARDGLSARYAPQAGK